MVETASSTVGKSQGPLVFRTPAAMRYLSLFGTGFLGLVTALMIALAIILIFQKQLALAAILAAVGVFMAALTGYVARDLRGKWGLKAEMLGDRLVLDLPEGRSLVHRPKGQHLDIPYNDIEAIETRLEGIPSLGMMNLQRAFVLVLKSGERIFLFEERALATGLETPMYYPIVKAILDKARVPLRDLGMVEGKGGFLSMWGTSSPDWSAPSLRRDQQLRIWRHAAATGSLAFSLIILAFTVEGLAKLFGGH